MTVKKLKLRLLLKTLLKMMGRSEVELSQSWTILQCGSDGDVVFALTMFENLPHQNFMTSFHGAQVSSNSEDILQFANLSSKSSNFSFCTPKVLQKTKNLVEKEKSPHEKFEHTLT